MDDLDRTLSDAADTGSKKSPMSDALLRSKIWYALSIFAFLATLLFSPVNLNSTCNSSYFEAHVIKSCALNLLLIAIFSLILLVSALIAISQIRGVGGAALAAAGTHSKYYIFVLLIAAMLAAGLYAYFEYGDYGTLVLIVPMFYASTKISKTIPR